MGVNTLVAGVAGVDPLYYGAYPVLASLKDLFHLGGDESSSVTNLASGRTNASAAGDDVTYEDGYAVFAGDPAYNVISLATAENELTNFTRLGIAQHVGPLESADDWRQVIGDYEGPAEGTALWSTTIIMANGNLRQRGIGIPDPPHSKFYFIAMTYNNTLKKMASFYGARGQVYAGGAYTDTVAAARSAAPLKIGGNNLLGANERVLNVAMAAQHNAVLSTAELREVMLYEAERLRVDHGITIA